MWMVGYNNDGGDFSNVADHSLINGSRKLRPLMPRPMISSTATTPCLNRIHHHNIDFFPQYNHNLAPVAEHGKKEFNTSPVVVSSRWNPTPEQLSALEELYRRGTRTPSAEQIQHITAQLRRFGKIEGKNVFYWFQNHKARERQKRRRQMESAAEAGHPRDFDTLEKKDFGASRTVFEAEQTKNWTPSTNCTSTLAEESVSIQSQRAAKAAVSEGTDGWNQFDEGELQQRKNFMERNGTWHAMQYLSCPPPTAPTICSTASIIATTTTVTATAMEPKLVKPQSHDLSFFITSCIENGNMVDINSISSEEEDCVESQTLQLFPLRSDDGTDDMNQKDTEISVSAMNANFTPSQFFEFLPLKN